MSQPLHLPWVVALVRLVACCALAALAVHYRPAQAQQPAGPKPPRPPTPPLEVTLQGLFMPERADDFRAAVAEIPELACLEVEYDTASALNAYNPEADLFRSAKPEQRIERIDQLVRAATRGLFGVQPRRETPLEKLERVEIAIVGLDCKACSLAAYEIVAKLEGVAQAQASFKAGRVTAWIDPVRTSRAALVAALQQRNVQLGPQP